MECTSFVLFVRARTHAHTHTHIHIKEKCTTLLIMSAKMMLHGAQAQFNDFEGHVSLQECSGEAHTGP